MSPPPAGQEEAPTIDSLGGLFLILFARVLGYLAMAILAFAIARRPPWDFSVADVLLWATAVAVAVARHRAAVRYGPPGRPARPLAGRFLAHLGAAAGLWLAAHSVRLPL